MSFAALGIGGVLKAVGAGIGAISAVAGGMYQAQIAKNNADIARQNAQLAAQKSQDEAKSNDENTKALIGEQLAVQAASGLNANTGSTLRVRQSTNRLGRADSYNIRQQGAYEVQNYLQQANNFEAESKASTFNAVLGGIGGAVDVGTSLISGASTTRLSPKLNRDRWIMANGKSLRTLG